MKLAAAIAGLALLGAVAAVQASPVDVTFTTSGSAGNWVYDFSVTNNLPSNEIYSFGVTSNSANSPSYPVGWTIGSSGLNWSIYGGSNTNYSNTWITCPTASCPAGHPLVDVEPGQTLSGFEVLDSGATPLTSVGWYVTTVGVNGAPYTGSDCSFICNAPHDNPGFEGFAAPAVPVPAAAWLFGSGLIGFAGLARKRKSI